jgi:hypothetical protein
MRTAEAAVIDGIGCCEDLSPRGLLIETVRFAVRRGTITAKAPYEVGCFPPELQALFMLQPLSRHCFVLQILVGLSFKWVADKFREHPGAVPSDFVPEDVAVEFARKTVDTLAAARVTHFGIRVHGAGEYPMKLRVADHPVELLYFQGWWDLVDSRGVAVVGTRQPSEQSIARTRKLVRCLVDDKFTVVSGLAKGIEPRPCRA